MDDFTSALKEALDGGKSLDEAAKEILRKRTEKAVNTIIRERGVKRCDVVVSDGFVGMKEIVRGRFPDCRYQRCFVHLARNAGDMVRPSGMQSIVADFMSLAKLGGKDEAEERFLTNLANYCNLRKWRRRVKCWRYLDDPLA